MIADFAYYWRVRKYLPERFGKRCRVFARGQRMNSIGVEFEDGKRYVTIKWFVRRATL